MSRYYQRDGELASDLMEDKTTASYELKNTTDRRRVNFVFTIILNCRCCGVTNTNTRIVSQAATEKKFPWMSRILNRMSRAWETAMMRPDIPENL